MMIISLTLVALSFFCVGAFLVFKGYWQAAGLLRKKQEQEIVPILDPREIEDLKQDVYKRQILVGVARGF